MRSIWLASYPKSGNTWLRLMIANIAAADGGDADINALPTRGGIASARASFDNATLLDSGLLTFDEIDAMRPAVYEALADDPRDDDGAPEQSTMRFVKAHDAYALTPSGAPLLGGARGAAGVIVIVRDPRDIVSSFAHHSQISNDEAIDFMNDDGASFCGRRDRQHGQLRQRLFGWSGHVQSWLDQRDIQVHLMRYEDLRADPTTKLRAALGFAHYDATAAAIERAVRLTEFDALAKQEREQGFREAPDGRRFFRRGIAGGWRDELTSAQVARIESAHAPMMRRLGYEPVSQPRIARCMAAL